ncbi:hypothetical protein CDA63_02850 [Hymenobacter amundsenii]|uniref:DUF3575 domain-containing protein n=2 Tax=Hymenobacter amundsenii TaxID=2006685 RepID=A0A246FSI3_9BACT|nr:hypothetical protein CDA63_02850 [Hymenobacter amundsenii]
MADLIRDGSPVLPLLLGYERQVGQHLSGNIEILLTASKAKERATGLALQMRYYIASPRYPTALAGFYVAPTVSSRLVKRDYRAHFLWYTPSGFIQRRTLGGAGALVGRQAAFGPSGRLLFDASIGLMSWKQLNSSADIPAGCKRCTDEPTSYENTVFVPDGRLSLGYRF